MSKKGKKANKSQKPKVDYKLSDNAVYDLGGKIQSIINQNATKNRRKQKQSESESDSQWEAHIQGKKFRQINYQRVPTDQLYMIPQLMKQRDLKIKTGITQKEQQIIEDEIRRMDPTITAAEAHAGVFAISNRAVRRRVYGEGFPNSLLQELYETNIRVNRESMLIEEKYLESNKRCTENINARSVEPSMNLGSR
ncbi:MAG: hypothetical protein EZS28_005229 [Streblomastix strix]|uniref:Uncharacterized protein n=1 Tax=Streblomastix strix TaxID=222440 RepID=A0A5J4WW95_9EUKA|nr:MAG: hypothetical protein EZS28_005229 [Streblomastix strix]